MKKGNNISDLRRKAEKRLRPDMEAEIESLSGADAKKLLHELRVHQIELEMQNEELRRAQVELEESRSRYSDLYDFAPVGYFTLDKKGLILEANLTGAGLLGIERALLIKKPFSQYILKDYKDKFFLHQRKVSDTSERQTCEIKLRNKKGAEFYAQLESIAVKNLKQIRVAVSDISRRKEAEEELYRIEWLIKKSLKPKIDPKITKKYYEQPYGNLSELNTSRVLLDAIPEDMLADIAGDYLDLLETSAAIYEKNGDYALGIFSSGWCRFLDNTSRNLCATSDNSKALASGKWLCHESCWTNASKVAIESGQPVDIECKGGIRLYAVPILAGSDIVGSINIGYGDPPMDKERLLEIAKRYSVSPDQLAKYADNYESRPPYIIESAKRRLTTSANLIGEIVERRRAESALKKTKDELEMRVEERTADLKKTNTLLNKEIIERRQMEEGLKKAKEEIEVWNRELEKRVKEKTEELVKSQNQLIQSEKLSAMGEMAGGLVHELNSPLAGLIPMLQDRLEKAQENSDDHEDLTLMLKAANHMARIVKDFGLFSRKSEGDYKLLDLNEVIEDTLSFSTTSLRYKGIKVKKELSSDPLLIRGDRTELQQVVLNMISNALYATAEGGRFITRTDISEDNKIVMQFIDNGIGIEKEHIDRIFDPFFTTKPEGKGTGLGLSVTYGIIMKHGGDISVESEPGKGTKFTIYLPAVKQRS